MSVTDSELLTPAESRLNDLEAIITTGKRSFIEVGNALSEIQANGLYEAKYKTFAKYCEQRWGFSRQYAYWMIQGCDAKKSLPEHVTTYVDSPTKAAAAAKVPIEKRSETVLAAQAKADAEGRKMRAQDIADAATVDADPAQGLRPDEDERWRALQRGEAVLANAHRDKALIQRAESRGLAVRIDRKGPGWGNPWIEGLDGARDKVCDNYHDLYWPTKPSLHKRLHEVSGKLLVCWCYPERCHGLTIIEALNKAEVGI